MPIQHVPTSDETTRGTEWRTAVPLAQDLLERQLEKRPVHHKCRPTGPLDRRWQVTVTSPRLINSSLLKWIKPRAAMNKRVQLSASLTLLVNKQGKSRGQPGHESCSVVACHLPVCVSAGSIHVAMIPQKPPVQMPCMGLKLLWGWNQSKWYCRLSG